MTVLRWIAFIPIALVVSVVAGALGNYAGQLTGNILIGSGEWYAWGVSGFFSAFAFFWAGLKVAPRITPAVRWSLVGLLSLLGVFSTLGGFVEGGNPNASWAGVVMLLVAVATAKLPPESWPGIESKDLEGASEEPQPPGVSRP